MKSSASPAQTSVVLRVYDRRAGYATQAFAIDVAGGNFAPVVAELEPEYTRREGEPFEVGLFPLDPEGAAILQWADRRPPGAVFDAESNVFSWAPGFDAAGVYEGVTLYASDGVNTVSRSFRITVEPENGAIVLSSRPGLGVELEDAKIERRVDL